MTGEFDIHDHLRRANFGQGGGGNGAPSGDGIANEKESPEIIVEGIKKVPGTVAKLSEAIPIIGSLIARLIPTNLGEVSAFASLESQGIAGKNINPMRSGPPGGVLYHALAPLVKNGTITDQTGGTGGGSSGGGDGSWGDGGGGYHSDFHAAHHAAFSDLGVSPGGQFDWSPIAWASLGGLPRPVLPDMGPAAELSVA